MMKHGAWSVKCVDERPTVHSGAIRVHKVGTLLCRHLIRRDLLQIDRD